jgi:hypothetical protein
VGDYIIQLTVIRGKADQRRSPRGIGDQFGRVALAPWPQTQRPATPGDPLDRGDDGKYLTATPGAQIQRGIRPAIIEVVKRI